MSIRPLRTTQAVVDLNALENNVRRVREQAETEIMAVIKADAYGHGACAMKDALQELGVGRFAVAALNEAFELLRQGPGRVMILGYTPDSLLSEAADMGAELTVCSLHQAELLSGLVRRARVHIKVDSGMHRLGFSPDEDSLAQAAGIFALPGIEVGSVYTHLALKDRESDERQFAVFSEFCARLFERTGRPVPRHVCDGLGMCRYPHMRLDMVRPGGALYGFGEVSGLRPVMTLRSQVACVHTVPAGEGVGYDLLNPASHTRRIATLPFGYSDGVPRSLSCGAGHVVIRGQKAPFAGLLCMDMCMADVTGIEGVREGDEVFVIGGHENAMTFPGIAAQCGLNRNGVQSGIARRVPRVYMKGNEVWRVRGLV